MTGPVTPHEPSDVRALRRRLTELAGAAPALGFDPDALERRALAATARRRTGLLSATALVAGLALTVALGGEPPAGSLRADQPPAASASVSPAASRTPPPSDAPSAEPSPSASPDGGTAVTDPDDVDHSHTDPGSPADGPIEFIEETDGVAVRLAVDDAWAQALQPVRFDVTITPPEGETVVDAMLDYADGMHYPVSVPFDEECRPQQITDSAEHAFRSVPGHFYEVRLVVRLDDGPACDDWEGDRMVEFVVPVFVSGGRDVTNGPSPAIADLSLAADRDTDALTDVTVDARALDHDGWVTEAVVDWGDGSAPWRLAPEPFPCPDEHWRWPIASLQEDAKHDYAPGRYTVVFTVVTGGCDGSDRQVATERRTITVPLVEESRIPR